MVGILILDNVEVLQQVIDDHFKASNPKQHERLTRRLQLLCNFLKNLYPEHVGNDKCAEWTTHSIEHALGVPVSVNRKPHYCMLPLEELEELMHHRQLPLPKGKSVKSRVDALMADDLARETAEGSNSDSSSISTDTSSDTSLDTSTDTLADTSKADMPLANTSKDTSTDTSKDTSMDTSMDVQDLEIQNRLNAMKLPQLRAEIQKWGLNIKS